MRGSLRLAPITNGREGGWKGGIELIQVLYMLEPIHLSSLSPSSSSSQDRQGVNYTDLTLPGSFATFPSQAGVQYSQVRM